jgi:hypothetical protein
MTEPTNSLDNTLVMITRPGMGDAPPKLAETLLKKYLALLVESGTLPGAVALYAGGIRMACEGSPVLAELRALEERKVPIILCATCLAFYELEGKVRTGIVGGMGDIIAAQQAAAKVVGL